MTLQTSINAKQIILISFIPSEKAAVRATLTTDSTVLMFETGINEAGKSAIGLNVANFWQLIPRAS